MSEPVATPVASVESAPVETAPIAESNQSTPEQLVQEIESTVKDAEKVASPEVQNALKKFKLKVDGQEVEEEIDLSDESRLIQALQMEKVAQKRMNEAAELRKADTKRTQELADFIAALKENPKEILEYLGHDVKNMAEKILEEEVKKMEMDPKEREILELKKELENRIKMEKEATKKAEAEELERVKNQYASDYEKQLVSAIKEHHLEQDPETIQRMTQYMRVALQNGIDLSFSDIAPLVGNSLRKDMAKLIKRMNIEEIEALLQEDHIKELIKRKKPQKVVPPTASEIKDTANPPVVDNGPKKRTINAREFFKSL